MSERPTVAIAFAPVLSPALLGPEQLQRLRAVCDVPSPHPLERLDDDRAAKLLARAEILLTGWGCPPLDEAVLARAPHLRAVFHAAGTIRNHVREACWQRGLVVSSAAAANAIPVAEYALAAILMANKRVFQLQRGYREARAFRFWALELPDAGNYRKRVGLVGASRTGRRLLEMLRPFDFEVWVADPYLDESEADALGVRLAELDTLLATCDVVSLHAPLLPATRGLLDTRRLALLRDGATLVNTARGGLVDGAALEKELVSGRIAAVIDTTEPEVLLPDSPLYDLPNVFLTPHVAGAMGSEVRRLVDLALDEIERYVRGDSLAHEVRREDMERIA